MKSAIDTHREYVRKKRVAAIAVARAAKLAKPAKKIKRRAKPSGGVIIPDHAYSLEQIAALFGIGPHTMRRAEREGLEYTPIGSRKFFKGEDILAHFAKKKTRKAVSK